MSRLRNRQVKADFYTDAELCRWPRDKRHFYQSLWAMAEDSGCIEDDPFDWKMTAWASPLDTDLTVELFKKWRDELVRAKKLRPYKANGKRYLYMAHFHDHEHPRNPQSPNLPLPPWIEWVQHPSDLRKGQYRVVQGAYNESNDTFDRPGLVWSGPVLSGTDRTGQGKEQDPVATLGDAPDPTSPKGRSGPPPEIQAAVAKMRRKP